MLHSLQAVKQTPKFASQMCLQNLSLVVRLSQAKKYQTQIRRGKTWRKGNIL